MAPTSCQDYGSRAKGSTPTQGMTVLTTRCPIRRPTSVDRTASGEEFDAERVRRMRARPAEAASTVSPSVRGLKEPPRDGERSSDGPRGPGLLSPIDPATGTANPRLRAGETVDPTVRDRGPLEEGIVEGDGGAPVNSRSDVRVHGGRWPAAREGDLAVDAGRRRTRYPDPPRGRSARCLGRNPQEHHGEDLHRGLSARLRRGFTAPATATPLSDGRVGQAPGNGCDPSKESLCVRALRTAAKARRGSRCARGDGGLRGGWFRWETRGLNRS